MFLVAKRLSLEVTKKVEEISILRVFHQVPHLLPIVIASYFPQQQQTNLPLLFLYIVYVNQHHQHCSHILTFSLIQKFIFFLNQIYIFLSLTWFFVLFFHHKLINPPYPLITKFQKDKRKFILA